MRKLVKFLILLSSGGLIYVLIELLYRGRSHWSMFLVGGICFVLIGGLNNWFPWNWSILRQMGISAAIVTAVEFVSGILLNMVLNLDVWDYSNMPFNIYGQICLPFTVIWFFLSFLAIVADDFSPLAMVRGEIP